MKEFLLGSVLVAVSTGVASAASLTNGGFEQGDLTGWTTFTTTNGTLGAGFPNVVAFDTNGDTNQSLAAQFRVGQNLFQPNDPAGGGIFQAVDLFAGDLTISVDVAASTLTTGGNLSGGLFELLFDGSVVDSFDSAFIVGNTVERSLLVAITNVAPGTHEIRIQMTRPFVSEDAASATPSPIQYIDNVSLTGTAVDPEVVPLPAAAWMGMSMLGGLGVTQLVRRRRTT